MSTVEHGAGTLMLTKDRVAARYIIIIFRTLAAAADPAGVKSANALQDRIEATQAQSGSFEMPEWDEKSFSTVRDAVNVLAATKPDASDMFGDKHELDPINHLPGTAFGWGGNPEEAAVYANVVPSKNDGKTPCVLTAKDVPVDGFWFCDCL